MNQSKPGSKVGFSTLFYFGLPTVAYGYMFCLVTLYYMKYATDILLISPAVMGLIFGLSRFWDAVSDPLVGYWSDRTKFWLGRRRSWIGMSALPTALTFLMIFVPPQGLGDSELVIWVGVGIIGFFSASTFFYVPQMALGAELTDDHHERNKVFGVRHAGWIGGYIIGIGAMAALISAEQTGIAAVQETSRHLAYIVAPLGGLSLIICAYGIREREEFASRGGKRPFKAIRDVFKNPHARPPLIGYFFDNIGFAFTSILMLYVGTYILEAPEAAPKFLLTFLIPSFLLTPVWMPLARRVGKKTIWSFSMYLSAMCYGLMFTLGKGDELLLMGIGFLAGIANGAGHVIGPSLMSDTIDYDELQTGERKEGAYFAAWNFTWKLANGISLIVVGNMLSWVGFQPNVAQAPEVILAIKIMFSIVPCLAYVTAALVFSSYRLDEKLHVEMHAVLDENRAKTAQ